MDTTIMEETLTEETLAHPIAGRFRGFLPVVVDVETAGFIAETDALLEIAFVPIIYNAAQELVPGEPIHAHIEPFEGARLDQRSLTFIGVDVHHPMRKAIAQDERSALKHAFKQLTDIRRAQHCNHCVLVGHNAHFDLAFLKAAIERTKTKNQNPFHSFSVFDTVTLAAMRYGQTVLAKACESANIPFSNSEAHSALYDAQKTAALFCTIINQLNLSTLDFVQPTA